MDADLVEFNQNGKVRFAGEEWNMPTLQERRAILYAAQNQVRELQELIQSLE
jgi:acyl-CoA reductase-like NAD-dependent aldehyde dehydrogenase